MARPKSEEKREAIIDAAIRVIVAQGLSAPTATIAREAGIANGSLFTYFETKIELWNALYVELKLEMARASTERIDPSSPLRAQLHQAWSGWLHWATTRPERRKVLALLGTSDEITAQSRLVGRQDMAPLAQLVERCRVNGPMRNASPALIFALLNATADATIDVTLDDPTGAARYAEDGFEAAWRMIA